MGQDRVGPFLTVQDLALERGGRLLFSGLSFEIEAGQLVQLEGTNGAGKTSLMRILAGLSRYGFDGSVQRHRSLLFLGHNPAVKGLLTPRENLAWHLAGASSADSAAIDAALERVGLYGYEDVLSHTLSAGQHRRVNLARLYLSDRPLWLLDEPFTAIDRDGVEALETLLEEHVASGGTVIVTSHQVLSRASALRRLSLVEGLLP